MIYNQYKKTLEASLGKAPADLVFKGGQVLNVFSGEILTCDVAVVGDRIVGLGQGYEGRREIDVTGKYLAPGFIDAHMHIESSMMTPESLSTMVVPWGTTTLIADPHEIANVLGIRGVEYILEHTENLPVNVFVMMPSCVPATAFETNGAVLSAAEMKRLKNHKRVLGLGEAMDYVSVVGGARQMYDKLQLFGDRMIDGHAPKLSGKELQAYRLAGVRSDHECRDYKEGLEKIRAGLWILVREGSAARNLDDLITGFLRDQVDLSRCMFCTDDKTIEDIYKFGHISYNIRRSIELGVPPVTAYKMATLNPALCYGFRDIGAIGPGYTADIVVLDDFETVQVDSVWHKGKLVSSKSVPVEFPKSDSSIDVTGTIKIPKLQKADLAIQLKNPTVPVIQLVDYQILTKKVTATVKTDEKGCFVPDRQYQKLAVIERHHETGNIGLGIIEGFNLENCAIAATVAHDSHNLIVVGDNDRDMLAACKELKRCGGGYTIVSGGKPIATLELPLAGMMSRLHPKDIQEKFSYMIATARSFGVPVTVEPYMTLSFMALPVIPELRVTDMGLFDVTEFRFLDWK